MDITLEGLGIITGRENVCREAIPQSNRGREKSTSVSYRATESRSDNIGMSLGRFTGDKNRVVERWHNS